MIPERTQPNEFAALARAEDRHFWFTSRNRLIREILEPVVSGLAPGYRVIEIGCGTGNVLRVLEATCTAGYVVGMELFAEGLGYARARVRCGLVRADVRRPPFSTTFDVACLFDVLEHLPDDAEALDAVRSQLAPGGVLVLTVPAFQALWSYADDHAGHYRRYSSRSLRTVLERAGFRVQRSGYFMLPLLPALWASRRLAGRNASPSPEGIRNRALRDLEVIPAINGAFNWLLSQEARLICRGWTMPAGTSLFAVAIRD